MAAAGRKRDIAIRVMVTAKEQAEIRKAANKAAMPMSVYVRVKARAARADEPWRDAIWLGTAAGKLCADNIHRSMGDIRKLMALAGADDPEPLRRMRRRSGVKECERTAPTWARSASTLFA